MNSDHPASVKNSISLYFFDILQGLLELNYTSVQFEDDSWFEYAAGTITDPDDPLNLVFSISRESRHLFFFISDGPTDRFSRDLAALQQYTEREEELCVGHTVPTANSCLIESGYFGYTFLGGEIYHDLFAKPVVLADSSLLGLAVIPITKEELDFKKEYGKDALYDRWDQQGKDPVHFHARTQ